MRPPFDPRAFEESAARGTGRGRGLPSDALRSSPGRGGSPVIGTPPWLSWLQVGLSSMLAVLFLVMLVRSREQNLELQRLRQRIKLIETSRSLDRGAAQEEKIRAVGERVQTLEEIVSRRLEASERERQRIEQKLLDLHIRPQLGRPPGAAPPSLPDQAGPRLQRGAALPGGGVLPLRPPSDLP